MRLKKTKYPLRTILAWLYSHHSGCKLQAVLNCIIGLLEVALGLYGVHTLRTLTDIATGSREGSIGWTAALLATIFITELLLRIGETWITAVLGVKAQNNLQKYFFKNLLCAKWRGIERYHSGDVLNRLFSDVNDIVNLMTDVLPSVIIVLVQFTASLIYLYTMDESMALILVVTSPLFILLSRVYFQRMRRIVRKIKDNNSSLQAIIQESVQHKMVVKTMERTDDIIGNLHRRQSLLQTQYKARARFSIIARSFINVGFLCAYLGGLTWGLFQLQAGVITVGVLMAFTQLINRIQRPLLDLARMLPIFVNAMTSCERLMELEQLPQEDDYTPQRLNGKVGVRFSNVCFNYAEDASTHSGREVLSKFCHDFTPGSFTAILGETGAGKTTLIRMMLSLIAPTKGECLIYNNEKTHPLSNAHRINFSYIPQGNTLFSGTIRENLLMGKPDASNEELNEALRLAMADFVHTLPRGMDTRCAEQGGGLSEGQAQRIAIARALLRPCSILLLDEATSALDIATEEQLLKNIQSHFRDTTIIFVTHRLAVTDYTTDVIKMERNK